MATRVTAAQQRAQRTLTPQQTAALPLLTAELTLQQEYELNELKQASTVLFFVNDKRVQDDLKREKEKKEGGRKTRCLKVVGKYLQEKQVPGGTACGTPGTRTSTRAY